MPPVRQTEKTEKTLDAKAPALLTILHPPSLDPQSQVISPARLETVPADAVPETALILGPPAGPDAAGLVAVIDPASRALVVVPADAIPPGAALAVSGVHV